MKLVSTCAQHADTDPRFHAQRSRHFDALTTKSCTVSCSDRGSLKCLLQRHGDLTSLFWG
eukprot:9484256-Pyramimonas_sp.AAC.1